MNVFVTGASGNIGAQVVQLLRQHSHKVTCLVGPSDDVRQLASLNVTVIKVNITDKALLLSGMAGCEWVVNLAEVHSCWESSQRIFREVNNVGTKNTMECALEAGVAKVIHLSSAILYDNSTEYLFQKKGVRHPTRLSEYTRTKSKGDAIARELYQKRNLPLVMIYTGNPVGLNNYDATTQHIKNVISRRVRVRAFDDVVITYISVFDIANAIVKALEKEGNVGKRYLIGSEKLSVREFDEILRDITGVSLAKVIVPESLVHIFVTFSTSLSRLTKKPPFFDISADSLREFSKGLVFDGDQARQELGFTYTAINEALREAILAIKLENKNFSNINIR